MAQVIKKATRESFGMALCELAKTNKDIIVFDADLAAATKTGIFKKEFPERFFDCGIAEGNMVGVAAGMAAAGKIPVAASFAMFATGRAFEQIRNSVAYPHLNVKIAGSHAGISTGEDGATHQCLEDIGIMRTIPGMVVLNPADHYEMMAATKAAIEYNGPVYIRLGAVLQRLHPELPRQRVADCVPCVVRGHLPQDGVLAQGGIHALPVQHLPQDADGAQQSQKRQKGDDDKYPAPAPVQDAPPVFLIICHCRSLTSGPECGLFYL